MDTNDLTEKIIGAAHKVLFALKPGLDEKLYERALVIELSKQGIECDTQREFIVRYDGQHIGSLVPDLIIGNLVIVDTKVVTSFNASHFAQMLGCLNITGLKTALLLNFKHAKLPDQARLELSPFRELRALCGHTPLTESWKDGKLAK